MTNVGAEGSRRAGRCSREQEKVMLTRLKGADALAALMGAALLAVPVPAAAIG